MAKCNRKQRLLGKSIRRIRMCRNMTQRELANAAGLVESAFRSYELGERSPKQNTLERIAKALDVAPACFDTYGIEHYDELMHALFLSEEAFSNIQAAAKRHGTAKGLHFYYADEPEPDDLLPSKRGIRVRCVETGVVYKTITQAAKETGASQAGIRGAASGMAGGYRWEYVDD